MVNEANQAATQSIDEIPLTLAQAARIVPNKVAPLAIWRWIRQGLLAADGTRVKLKARRYGRQLFTTKRDLDDFAEELAQRDLVRWESQEGPPKQKTAPKPKGRRADDDQLSAELAAKGY